MLRNILFAIDGIREGKALRGQLAVTMAELSAEWNKEETGVVRAVLPQELDERMEEWELQLDDTVVITDHAGTAQSVHRADGAVVAVFTEQNRGDSFGEIRFAVDGLFNPGLDYFRKVYERCHGIPWTILRTKRCIVREIKVEDLERLYEIYAEPSMTRYMEPLYEDREMEKSYTEAYIRNMYGFYGYGIWIVEDRETGRILGRAGLENREDGEIELGYMLAKEAQGKCIAYEVCSAILEYAEEVLGIGQVGCYVRTGNQASVRLCERLGFTLREEREIKGRWYQIYRKPFGQTG